MDLSMEDLEKKMGNKIDTVKDMMLDRFSGVDQKLGAIEELLMKIIEVQNQTGSNPSKKRRSFTENDMGGGNEASENQENGNELAERGVGGLSCESGLEKPVGEVAVETNAGGEEQHTGGSLASTKDTSKPASAEEGSGVKRKRQDIPVGGPNDGPISSEVFTISKRLLDMFTADEQKIVIEIESIKQSVRSIMHQKGYNDEDPLSADDQTYILENVFNHHPEKARKMGAGVDYIMISKHMAFKGSRCFYVVSIDGRKEHFCYHECLWNFITAKYPNNLDEFIPKYFEYSEPRLLKNRDCDGSGLVEPVTRSSWSGWDREKRAATDKAGPSIPDWRSAVDIDVPISAADIDVPLSTEEVELVPESPLNRRAGKQAADPSIPKKRSHHKKKTNERMVQPWTDDKTGGPSKVIKRSHKKKADETRAPRMVQPWTVDETFKLARAWLEVSEDPQRDYQTPAAFWARVRSTFFRLMDKDEAYRRPDQISGKWTDINTKCQLFNIIYNELPKVGPSDASNDFVIDAAMREFKETHFLSFKYKDIWMLVHNHPKWEENLGLDVRTIRPSKRSKTSSFVDLESHSSKSDTFNINIAEEEFEDELVMELPRPGDMRSVGKGKQTSSSAANVDHMSTSERVTIELD